MSSDANREVAVLMATYQGARFIREQLHSLYSQSCNDWALFVSDDGSTDETIEIINSFKEKVQRPVNIYTGPGKGFVRNFLTLLMHPSIRAKYYSFSDQDDIWFDDKIKRAVAWLELQPQDKPALYCSRTHLVNEAGDSLGLSPFFRRAPAFSNALVQNVGGGNTMMFNQAAREIIIKAGLVDVVSHDWWIYILITAVGGSVHYDAQPSLYYRQHAENLIGSNQGYKARLLRLMKIFRGQYREWNHLHILAVENNYHLLTPENQKRFDLFKNIHDKGLIWRLVGYFRLRPYRQTWIDGCGMFVAVLLKKV